jgi:hypothetical protein
MRGHKKEKTCCGEDEKEGEKDSYGEEDPSYMENPLIRKMGQYQDGEEETCYK